MLRIALTVILLLALCACARPAADRQFAPGPWNRGELARLITELRPLPPGERIVHISHLFLGAPYAANTLRGGPQQAEQLVVNLAEFDCFTLLDTIEALRRAATPADFPEQLKQVRYRGGKVAYASRRHFFSDWVAADSAGMSDVTAAVGQGRARVVAKQLNQKEDGSLWLPGLPVTGRDVTYIPTVKIDRVVLSALQAGDYVGIYAAHQGADVSHTGLIVKTGARVLLRHASSSPGVRRVVDVDLLAYLQGKPGLVVYRASRNSRLSK